MLRASFRGQKPRGKEPLAIVSIHLQMYCQTVLFAKCMIELIEPLQLIEFLRLIESFKLHGHDT